MGGRRGRVVGSITTDGSDHSRAVCLCVSTRWKASLVAQIRVARSRMAKDGVHCATLCLILSIAAMHVHRCHETAAMQTS